MKPLTPEEQFQIQLDVENIKVIVKELREQVLALSNALLKTNEGLIAVNTTVTAHHGLMKAMVEKIQSDAKENIEMSELLEDIHAILKTALHNGHHDLIERVKNIVERKNQ